MKMLLLNKNVISLALFLAIIECSEPPSVLILGAGASGIAAASRLLANNITNIKILEANDRIGGRIHSVDFGDAVVDLGAQWCHGQDNNVVYDMVKNLDLLETDDFGPNIFYSTGQEIDDEFRNELMELFYKYFGVDNGEDNVTIGEYFLKHYTEAVLEKYKNNTEKLAVALASYHLFDNYIKSYEGAFSSFNVALKGDYVETGGDRMLGWKKRGYKTILDVLMQKYPNPELELPILNKTELNKEVTEITWRDHTNNFTRLIVKCRDGSEYEADHVILTFSLGVLKKSHQTLFNPPLPGEKINAIKELGFEATSKIFFQFPNIWWGNFTDFNFVWSEQDRENLRNSTSSEDNKLWLLDFICLYGYKSNPHVLAGWFAGESVKDIELFSDEKVIDGIMYVVNKFLGHKIDNITPPDKLMRHKWYSDPYFGGTYSYQTLESRKRSVSGEVALSEPLISNEGKPTLLFAGESTHPHFYSTVHGAIETGRREADRIINLYS